MFSGPFKRSSNSPQVINPPPGLAAAVAAAPIPKNESVDPSRLNVGSRSNMPQKQPRMSIQNDTKNDEIAISLQKSEDSMIYPAWNHHKVADIVHKKYPFGRGNRPSCRIDLHPTYWRFQHTDPLFTFEQEITVRFEY